MTVVCKGTFIFIQIKANELLDEVGIKKLKELRRYEEERRNGAPRSLRRESTGG